MPLYRIKQFYWSITVKLDEEDIAFIHQYLNEEERKLFSRLIEYEQKHSINVARDVIKECKESRIEANRLIKAALLHDIGKITNRLNVVDKSVIVLLDKFTRGKLKKAKGIKKIDIYYNHGAKGVEVLKPYGYDDRLLYLIKNHHNNLITGDIELDILRKCDNNN